MTTQSFLTSAWNWNPVVLGGAAAAAVLYAYLSKFKFRWRGWFFVKAVILALIALVSPLNRLAEGYLFSAHMLQHLLLLLVIPFLTLLSLPAMPRHHGDKPGGVEKFFTRPALTWLSGVGAMWFWHVPRLCNQAAVDPGFRSFQTLSLLVLGFLFWWPILGPRKDERLKPLKGMLYLFTACLACSLLGIWITFSPVEVCSAYMNPTDPLGILPLIRNDWGMTMPKDQQVGGLIMWVPACFVYLLGILLLLSRWYGQEAAKGEPHVR